MAEYEVLSLHPLRIRLADGRLIRLTHMLPKHIRSEVRRLRKEAGISSKVHVEFKPKRN